MLKEIGLSYPQIASKEPGKLLHKRELVDRHNEVIEALIDSEMRYRRLFETAKDGILILDAENGMIQDVNPFLINLLGYSREQFLQKRIWEIGFFNDIIENLDKFVELQRKEYVRYDDLPLKTTDGRKIYVEFVSNVYLVNNHKVIQCNIRDITERKCSENEMFKARKQAEACDRLKTEFLHNMSHEIRTPLNGMLGFAEMIINPELTCDEKIHYLKMLNTSSDRLLNTINNFLDISLIDSGNMEAQPSPFTPADMLKVLLEKYHKIAAKKYLHVSYVGSDNNPNYLLNSDSEIIKKIFSHLLDNAIKFSDTGIILFGYQVNSDSVQFYVKDQGPGIDPEQQLTIFDHFMQEDTTITRRHEGSGLGLTIVKGLVNLLGGSLSVESVMGVGSEFYFTIPV